VYKIENNIVSVNEYWNHHRMFLRRLLWTVPLRTISRYGMMPRWPDRQRWL